MPQMSPMDWFLLMFFFLILYLLLMVFIYFMFVNYLKYMKESFVVTYNLKWY